MLKGKNAIITGSTSGIGLAIARSLAGLGANVILDGFGPKEEIDNILESIKKEFQVEAIFSDADMKDVAQIRKMIDECLERFGTIDILVNNAGIQYTSPVQDFPDDKWDDIIAINLTSAFYTIKAALPHMYKNKFGRIVNISSAHGLVASINKSAYVAAKHGINGLTKAVALEAAESGITCNSICPGWVLTPLVQKQIENMASSEKISLEEAKNKLLSQKQPDRKFVKPEDIGALVCFLCGPHGDAMTGEIISIDGGWTAC